MVASGLVDTGAIPAILDPTDFWHGVCAEIVFQLRPPLLTSETVLAELFHLIQKARVGPEKAWEFVHSEQSPWGRSVTQICPKFAS